VALHRSLRGRLGVPATGGRPHPLTTLVRTAAIPIAGLVLVAALQNVDVIMARHSLDSDTAGVYAATTVAAKFIVWVAVGIGLWVLPEATRRAAAAQDPRIVLVRALGLIGLLSIPALAAFAAFPGTLLQLAFGGDYRSGDAVLLPLGIAFALLACTFVAVQFLLGLHRRSFVVALAVVAVAEPLLLLDASSLTTFAVRVLVVQAAGAALAVGLALGARHDPLAQRDPVV
jgi:O-antigen/teichoic acid export membrane protein